MKVSGKIAVWVFCLMFLAIIILQSGNYSYVQDNGYKNFGPSGTSAFLELVKRSGYKLHLDETHSPAVAKTYIIPVSKQSQEAFAAFLKQIKTDTKIISLVVPDEDRSPSVPREITNQVTLASVGKMEPIRMKSEEWQRPQLEDADTVDLLTFTSGQTPIAQVVSNNEVQMIQVLDAACITNRNIDRVDNANIIMGLVSMIAKPGEQVTFIGTFTARQSEDSLMAKLGAPFQAACSQLLLLILVMFITLSVRFGLAPETRARQRSGRELIDGLAWMTRRKRNARWALRAVFDRVLAELERRNRIGREHIIQRPDLYLSQESARLLKDVEAATMDDITEEEAIRYAKALKTLV